MGETTPSSIAYNGRAELNVTARQRTGGSNHEANGDSHRACRVVSLPALAQNPSQGTPTRARGVVDKLDGQTLTVKSREGAVLTIALAPDVAIQTLVKKSLADIKPGDFVASTGIKDKDGRIHAIEVRISHSDARRR